MSATGPGGSAASAASTCPIIRETVTEREVRLVEVRALQGHAVGAQLSAKKAAFVDFADEANPCR